MCKRVLDSFLKSWCLHLFKVGSFKTRWRFQVDLQAVLQALQGSKEQFDVQNVGECLAITNVDGVTAHLSVCGSQVTVETLLFPADSVKDTAALNEYVLRTHKLVPLTAVHTTELDGNLFYSAFGALSSDSKLESVVVEVETLFSNVADLLEAYADFLE